MPSARNVNEEEQWLSGGALHLKDPRLNLRHLKLKGLNSRRCGRPFPETLENHCQSDLETKGLIYCKTVSRPCALLHFQQRFIDLVMKGKCVFMLQ